MPTTTESKSKPARRGRPPKVRSNPADVPAVTTPGTGSFHPDTVEELPRPAVAKASPNPTARTRATADLMRLAGEPTRLRVLMMLVHGERNVTELCQALGGLAQPALSHHLALCRASRLVETRRAGKFNYYSLTPSGRNLAKAIDKVEG